MKLILENHIMVFVSKSLCINLLLLQSSILSVILAKKPDIDVVAEIDSCEKRTNPQTYVGGCKYKLQLSLKILNSGQTLNTTEYLKIDKAYDNRNGKDVRLYNTVVLQIRQEQVSFVYPFHKINLVNNKAYEVFLTKDNTDDYSGCDEHTLPHLCGYASQDVNAPQPAETAKEGFCCPCLKDAQATHRYHLRGGQDCTNKTVGKGKKDTYHSSAHCLKYDPVWYSVNKFEEPHLEHIIHIDAFKAETEKEHHSWMHFSSGKEILLGSSSHQVTTANGMISASYTDFSFKAKETAINHAQQRLLIPRLNPVLMEKFMPLQMKEGPSRYLLLDKDMIDISGRSCDKAGVSYEAFVNQTNRCTSDAQSCLDKQPMHYWLEDVQNSRAGRKGKYFLSNYARLGTNPILSNTKTGDQNLVVMFTQPHESVVYLEINADGLLPLHEGIYGQISEVYFGPCDATHQQLYVDIFNRGWVLALYQVRLSKCINATAMENQVKSKLIEPNQSEQYVLRISKSDNVTGPASCVVEVQNEKDFVVAAREIKFHHDDRCICEGHCRCECLTDAMVCRPMSQEEYHIAGFRGIVPRHTLEPPHVGMQFTLTALVIVLLLLILGILKGLLGCLVPAVGHLGLSFFTDDKRQPNYYEKELWGMTVVYNEQEVPIHPVSGQPVRRMGILKEVCLNTVFFFYIPFIGFHYLILRTMKGFQAKATCTTEYKPKSQRFQTDLSSVDEESQEEDNIPIYENVFTPSVLRVEQNSSRTSNNQELVSQDSDEGSGDSRSSKKRRSKRKGSKTSSLYSQSRASSRTSQKSRDGKQSSNEDMDVVPTPESSGTLSKSTLKSMDGKRTRYSEDSNTGSAQTLRRSNSQTLKSQSTVDSDGYPGSARKHSIPMSQRHFRDSVRSRLSSLVGGSLNAETDSSQEKQVPPSHQVSIDSSNISSPGLPSNRSLKLGSTSGKGTAYDEVLKLAKSGRRVYYNYSRPDVRLNGSGNTFSLCGCLKTAGNAFEFNLDIHNVQVYKNQGGERQELDEPQELDNHNFRRLMSAEDVLQVITLYPIHPCLNKVLLQQSDSTGSVHNESSHSMFFSDH